MAIETWRKLLVSALALALPTPALAQEPPSIAPAVQQQAPPAVPDAVLRILHDRPVALQTSDGAEVRGHILSVEPDLIVFSMEGTNQVVSLPRANLLRVRLLDASGPVPAIDPRDVPPPPPVPQRQRHVGINLSLAPGLALDMDHGLFHGFFNVGIVLPLATNGGVVPFVIGLGAGLPVVPRRPNFRLDLFGYVAGVVNAQSRSCNYSTPYPYSCTSGVNFTIAFGAGMGVHYTWNNGLTMGFTVPILGYSAQAGTNSSNSSIAAATGYFYLASVEALPMMFIGYRL